MLQVMLSVTVNNAALARKIATYPWFIDGADDIDLDTVGTVFSHHDDPDLAQRMLDVRTESGSPGYSGRALSRLFEIAENDYELALTAIAYANAQEGDLREYLLGAIRGFSGLPQEKALLTSAPWFIDGLTAEEAAVLVPLTSTFQDVVNQDMVALDLLPGLMESYFVQSKTISLPLTGDVNIWVFQNVPFQEGEDVAGMVEDVVRFTERFFGAPFPTTDVISLIVVPSSGDTFRSGGVKKQGHFWLARHPNTDLARVIYHEVTHYYTDFYNSFGLIWMSEGTADYVSALVADRNGILRLSDRASEVAATVESDCVITQGIDNIRELSMELERAPWSPWKACAYSMGENLLHEVSAIGEGIVSATLGALYRGEKEIGEEELVYEAFLENTPDESKDRFRDVYQRLHGRPNVISSGGVDFNDDHSDRKEGATPISVGEILEGAFDYWIDSDVFRIEFDTGFAYQINVNHNTLLAESIQISDPGRFLTYDCNNRAICERTESGPQIYWRPLDTGEWHIGLFNDHGYTGTYTIQITRIEVTDDHGSSRAHATDISLGEAVNGSIEDIIDEDYFRFQAELGQKYLAEFRFSKPIRITNQYGWYPIVSTGIGHEIGGLIVRNITEITMGNEHSEEWVSPASGTYYFRVGSVNGGTGSYTFAIKPIE